MTRAFDPRSRYRRKSASAATVSVEAPRRIHSVAAIATPSSCAVCGSPATGVDIHMGTAACDSHNHGYVMENSCNA